MLGVLLMCAVPAGAKSIDGEAGFLQVRYDGELVYYSHNGSGFTAHELGWGWGQTSQVALVSREGAFLEVKNGILRLWTFNPATGSGLALLGDLMGGWQNTRLLAGVGDATVDGLIDFVQVNSVGQLQLWVAGDTGFQLGRTLGHGWENARQLAGVGDHGRFVSIKDNGELWSWSVPQAGEATGQFAMGGWGNVRLLGPGGAGESFVSLQRSSTGADRLVQWKWAVGSAGVGFQPVLHDWGWENTRLLG